MNAATPTAEKDYPDYVAQMRPAHPALADELAGFTGVGQVIGWMQRRGLDLRAVDTVSQDEFSYDFLLPLEEGRWLAFGVT
jgi:hypothetical protein